MFRYGTDQQNAEGVGVTSAQVKVRIRCMVEIPVGTWGGTNVLGELAEQAKGEGLRKLEAIMRNNSGKVLGTPSVVFVMAEEEMPE